MLTILLNHSVFLLHNRMAAKYYEVRPRNSRIWIKTSHGQNNQIYIHKGKIRKYFPPKNEYYRTSGQDRSIGRYALLPCITKSRTITNLKTKKQPEMPENQT